MFIWPNRNCRLWWWSIFYLPYLVFGRIDVFRSIHHFCQKTIRCLNSGIPRTLGEVEHNAKSFTCMEMLLYIVYLIYITNHHFQPTIEFALTDTRPLDRHFIFTRTSHANPIRVGTYIVVWSVIGFSWCVIPFHCLGDLVKDIYVFSMFIYLLSMP